MWPAERPLVSPTETARACARGTRDAALAARLLIALEQLERNSYILRHAAETHGLSAVRAIVRRLDGVTDEEMKRFYTRQLGRSGRPASYIRDQLIGSARHGLCCYCQYGQATTLDHFVPKDVVPALSIDPWNLVPACARCNFKLLAYFGDEPSSQMLYPYGMPELGRWLRAEAIVGVPTTVRFWADPSDSLDTAVRNRVTHEFLSLGLAPFFSVVSAPVLVETNATLKRLFAPGRASSVKDYLTEISGDAFVADPNSRRGVVLEALAADEEYCHGAYANDDA